MTQKDFLFFRSVFLLVGATFLYVGVGGPITASYCGVAALAASLLFHFLFVRVSRKRRQEWANWALSGAIGVRE